MDGARGAAGETLRWEHDVVCDGLFREVAVGDVGDGAFVSYVYDGSNRRVGKKIDGVLQQGFLYRDAIKPVVELDGAGAVVSRFVYGVNPFVPDYVTKGGNTYRIFTDQNGSPRVVVDVSSGSIVDRIDYDERGNTLQNTSPGFIPFGFAGGIVDADTGLIRFGARDYDASTGRWLRKEPLGFDGSDNFYQYAAGDPVNFLDFNGLDPCEAILVFNPVAAAEGFFVDYTFNAAAQVLESADGSYNVCEAVGAGILGGLGRGVSVGQACFAPETPVETADGEKPIIDIKVGDQVWSQDEVTGERELRTVLQKFVTPDQPLLDLDVVAGSKDEIIRATPTHRFWVDGKGWTNAEDLRAGDTFDLYSGKHAVFAGVQRELEKTTVYNLEVDGTHTYFVGDTGVWVHNACARYDGPKPRYQVNDQHVFGSPNYVPGKTPLPPDAESVFGGAVPDDPLSPKNWYGVNSDGDIYRYSGSNNERHFSGSSGSDRGINTPPPYVLQRLGLR